MQLHEQVRSILDRRINRGSTSLAAIAGKSGVGCSHLSNFRHGKRSLSVAALAAVISALDLDVELFPSQRAHTVALGRVGSDSVDLDHGRNGCGAQGRACLRSARLPVAHPEPS
jgi:transcriptional regulator with XRE-family HTH domain